jgi:hypothetical protein
MLGHLLVIAAAWCVTAQNPIYFTPLDDISAGSCTTDSLTSSTSCELHGAVNVSISKPTGPVTFHGSPDTRLQLAAITFTASPSPGMLAGPAAQLPCIGC